ncbi:hypothetical protein [Methylorubrum extorquens]
MTKKNDIMPLNTQPGETFEVRCASAATKVRVCFPDGTEIAMTIGPGQDISVTRGTKMIPTVILEDPETPLGSIALVDPQA